MNFVRFLNQDSDRPTQVTYAVFLLYVFLAVSFVILLLQTAVSLFIRPAGITIADYLINFSLAALAYMVMYFVAAKIAARKNWARWLLLVGFAVLMILTTHNMPLLVFGDATLGILLMVQVLGTAVAVALLFQRPCSEWFGSGKHYEQNDIQFDA
jgi:hypothetical protein